MNAFDMHFVAQLSVERLANCLAAGMVIALFTWHAMHRIFHSLHDVGLHTGVMAKLVCYGGALTVTVLVASALLVIGF